MRLYTFSHWMLRSIQQGIQPLHVAVDMAMLYKSNEGELRTTAQAVYHDWATHHKTVICLNGGDSASLDNIWIKLQEFSEKLSLPAACFHEDEQSLKSIMTSCGIVVPESIYSIDTRNALTVVGRTTDEVEFAMFLRSFSLAT